MEDEPKRPIGLQIKVELPADATDDEVTKIVSDLVLAASACHIAHGGSGLKIEDVVVTNGEASA